MVMMGARSSSLSFSAAGSSTPFCDMRSSPVAENVDRRKMTSMVIMSTMAVRFRYTLTSRCPPAPWRPKCAKGTERNSRGPGAWMGIVASLLLEPDRQRAGIRVADALELLRDCRVHGCDDRLVLDPILGAD